MSINEKMTAIADGIRGKTGGTEALTLDDIASGVNEVYEAGKTKEWSDFWDAYQEIGERTDYSYAFRGSGWNSNTFYPKYDIKPTGESAKSSYMFAGWGRPYIDMEKRLNECGVEIDFSQLTSSNYEFYLSKMTNLPVLDFSGCSKMTNTFDYCNFKTIKLKLSESGETTFSSTFRRCGDLSTVEIVSGVIGKSVSFVDSPLTVESMKSIITHLANYAGTDNEFTYTVTFKASTFAALEAEGATSPNGNSWAEYIDDLKWNLTVA